MRFCRMRVDIGKPRVDFRNPVRVCGGGCFFQKGGALLVRLHDDFDQRLLSTRRFLRHLADAGVLRKRYAAGFRRQIARNHAKQG